MTGGNNQATLLNTAFLNPLVVTVTPVHPGDPVAGGQLTFTPPSSGASATLSPGNPVTIAAGGTATVNATANGVAGSYQVTAGTAGASAPAMFHLTNQASTTTTVSDATTTFNANDQDVTLTANVASGGAGVTEGIVTFTVKQGSTIIGAATSTITFDSNGNAIVRYILPAGKAPAGSYTIEADYSDRSGKFAPSSGQATLTINKATPTVSVTDAGGPYTGNPYPASGTAVGVDGKTPVAGSFTFTYYSGPNPSGTPLPGVPSAAGTYTVVANFTSSDTNYSNGSAHTTFTITPATPTVSVTDAGGPYTGNPYPASGIAVGTDGKTPVAGNFSYTYYAGTDTSGTPLPGAPSNAGTYTVVANFTSSDTNYSNGSAHTTFTISAAATTTTASNATVTFSESVQNVTLTANVSSNAGAVNEGSVSFTIEQGSTVIGTPTTSLPVSNGQASVTYALPAGLAAGTYTIDAVYNPGPNFAASSDTTHSLIVASAAASIQLTSIAVVPNLLALNQTETINVHVSAPGGAVSGGTVTFSVDGQSVSASVDGSGNATANLTLPLLTTAFPQSITAAYSGPDASGSVTTTAFWHALDMLAPRVDTFAADGSQSVQSYLLGLPLLDFLYTSLGQLTQVVLGPNLLSWDFISVNGLTVVALDGVLPVAVMARTPQGQFLGAVQLTVSADGTLVVEAINAQGQVVSSQPI